MLASYSQSRFLPATAARPSHTPAAQPSKAVPALLQKPALLQRPLRRMPAEPAPVPPPSRRHQRQPLRDARGGGTPSAGGAPERTVRLAVVGDVHGEWDEWSEAALAAVGADVALFVGDLGNEDERVTERIVELEHEKAVVLGNHDAWRVAGAGFKFRVSSVWLSAACQAALDCSSGYSLTEHGRQRFARLAQQSSSLALISQVWDAPPAPAPAAVGGDGAPSTSSRDGVGRQLDALGGSHVGYSSRRFPRLGLSVVGGRPFSKGGAAWSDVAAFYEERYGVGSMHDSSRWLADLLLQQPDEDVKAKRLTHNLPCLLPDWALPACLCAAKERVGAPASGGDAAAPACNQVVLAHNGPTGLGVRRHDPCGIDWRDGEGDHGDPDLKEALDMASAQGCEVPLVLFGHMHSQLKGGGLRNRVHACPTTGTIYLNSAVVPRIRAYRPPAATAAAAANEAGCVAASSSAPASQAAAGGNIPAHHFMEVVLRGGEVAEAADVWVGVLPASSDAGASSSNGGCASSASGRRCIVLERRPLLLSATPVGGGSNSEADGGTSDDCGDEERRRVVSCYMAHSAEWCPVAVPRLGRGVHAVAAV
eukprot:scaffold5.g635.t1